MKKCILFCIAVSILLSCTACGTADLPEATQMPTAAPTQPHVCTSPCELCGLCVNENCVAEVCIEKCTGVHWEEPHAFSTGDYITTEAVSVDAGTLVFDIGENVYVPGNLTEMGETVVAEIEKVTGLDFDGAGYSNYFDDGKVHITVSREALYAGESVYQAAEKSEVGNAYADIHEHVVLSPGDLFFGNSKAFTHELTHILMYRQSGWTHDQMLDEGFAEYTTYLVASNLESENPKIGFYLERFGQSLIDMGISDYEKLYEQPAEYWLDHTFEHSINQNYAVGFRFMAYLHDVYGDYGKWIPAYEARYTYGNGGNNISPVDQRIEILKAVYGDDVFDNFYPWLKTNQVRFHENRYNNSMQNLKAVSEVNWYPYFNALESVVRRERVQYEDLYINIDSVRKYLEEYKRIEATGLQLITSKPVQVNLYHADGSYTTVMTNSYKPENPVEVYRWEWGCRMAGTVEAEGVLPLDDISYIKLVGAGKLDWMEIVGDFRVLFE